MNQKASTISNLILGTHDTFGSLVLRLGLAAVIWPHGAQKLLGWFGGPGFSGTVRTFTESMGIPAPLAVVVILTEFFGPVLLVLGLLTRLASLAIGVLMVVAVLKVHLPHGFFMNWHQQKEGEGFEYHILVITIALGLMILGGGKWAIDAALGRRASRASPEQPGEATGPSIPSPDPES